MNHLSYRPTTYLRLLPLSAPLPLAPSLLCLSFASTSFSWPDLSFALLAPHSSADVFVRTHTHDDQQRYTAHLMSPSTCCFTDWMGTGLQETSPIFQECFEDFLVKLDSLRREKTVGIPRRRASANVGPSSPGGSSLLTGMMLPSRSSNPGGLQSKQKRRVSRMHST